MNTEKIKKYLVTGGIVLMPLVLTFWILSFLINLLTTPFMDLTQKILEAVGLKGVSFFFLSDQQIIYLLSKILIIVFVLIIITFVGAVARHFFFRTLMQLGDSFLRKIPIIGSVYKTTLELTNTIFSPEKRAFQQVVLVPFPCPGALAIGLVTRSETILEDRISVFIPTAPSPISGYLIFFKKEDVRVIDMKTDEALRYIVSCGALLEDPSALK